LHGQRGSFIEYNTLTSVGRTLRADEPACRGTLLLFSNCAPVDGVLRLLIFNRRIPVRGRACCASRLVLAVGADCTGSDYGDCCCNTDG
jgi:hypothetical protein